MVSDDYPIPEYTVEDDVGLRHVAYFAGPDHGRYVRTTCDWWRHSLVANKTACLGPAVVFPPTCFVCMLGRRC